MKKYLPSRATLKAIAARPIWVQLARESAMFLGLALAFISVDSDLAMGSLWWSMALTAFGALLAGWSAPGLRLRPAHVGWALLAMFYLLLQAMRLTNGPGEAGVRTHFWGGLPATGVREALDWSVMLVVAVALWMYAAALPLRAAWVLVAALLVGWFNALSVEPRGPGLNPVTFSLFTALAVAVWSALRMSWRAWNGRAEPAAEQGTPGTPRRTMGPALILTALLALTLAGLFAQGRAAAQARLHDTPEAQQAFRSRAAEVVAGRQALGELWTQSLLLGWGRESLPRMAAVVNEPVRVRVAPWPGFQGFAAAHGLIAMMLFPAVGLLIMQRMVAARAVAPWLAHGLTALASVQLGLMIFGGVLAAMPLLILVLCFALMLRPAPQADAQQDGATAAQELLPPLWRHRICTAVLGGLVGLVLLNASRPVRGSSLHLPLRPAGMTPEAYRNHQNRALALNPHDPAIYLALASSWRETMSLSPVWSDSFYKQAINQYLGAQRADPYNTMIPIRLAELQALAAREEEAFATINAALQVRPRAVDLIQWGYLKAVNLEQWKTAYQMLDRGLRLAPEDPTWWRRSSELAQALGESQLAGRSLAVALTAEPGNPDLIHAAFKQTGMSDGNAASIALETLQP